jgi:hypothetical protein
VDTTYIRAVIDIRCEWEGLEPAYRIYVNEELFTERTWAWTDHYLEEVIQLQAAPGCYQVRLEPVPPTLARFTVGNHRVEHGPAQWVNDQTLEISACEPENS